MRQKEKGRKRKENRGGGGRERETETERKKADLTSLALNTLTLYLRPLCLSLLSPGSPGYSACSTDELWLTP